MSAAPLATPSSPSRRPAGLGAVLSMGIGQRMAVAGGAAALLWLAIGWAMT